MLSTSWRKYMFSIPNLTYSLRLAALKKYYSNKPKPQVTEVLNPKLLELIGKHEKNIIYNTVLAEQRGKLGLQFKRKVTISETYQSQKSAAESADEFPDVAVSLKYMYDDLYENVLSTSKEKPKVRTKYQRTHFPLRDSIEVKEADETDDKIRSSAFNDDVAEDLLRDVLLRQEMYNSSSSQRWMTDYENYDDDLHGDDYNHNWKINYGTPDRREPVSNVPCGGCGALLHCKDSSIPGYLPSEIYKNHNAKGGVKLKGIICQRCHFLKNYNLALQARVSPEDYPKILQTVSKKLSMVILMVDLLDFPCSVWPGIADIFWRTPMVVVGNKVDLLPQDSTDFLKHVKNVLRENITLSGFGTSNIQAVELISAKTGFGVETLVTRLQEMWKFKGDFYIVGCTNVGKSSLFNLLLQSDFCKVQASDLIQRATTSLWPGTTLNLLKFPVMRPSGWRQHLRFKRLQTVKEMLKRQNELRKEQLRKTGNAEYATLIGHLGRTFANTPKIDQSQNAFTTTNENAAGTVAIGINENDNDYKHSRWCFDTPGVVQPDQIIHLLTTEELTLTLPRSILKPRTFSLYLNASLFIAGLARLDYTSGPINVKVTVFCSENLPITICKTESAEEIYSELIGTDLFKVPTGQAARLRKWPALKPSKEFVVQGVGSRTGCADIVLSSAGWITVTGDEGKDYSFKGWTPEGRGMHLRAPLLPKIVNFRGTKVRGSPAFVKSKMFLE